MPVLRSIAVLAFAFAAAIPACAQLREPTPPAPAAPAPSAPRAEHAPAIPVDWRPRLVVLLTVDQLRPEYLERWRPQLTGGLRRLVDEGAFFTRAAHDHGITETAPGHASTLSGRFPYSTGIASNSEGVNTAAAPLVASQGTGASPFRFVGTTLVDWMRNVDSRTKVLSVSRKDRAAILPIGRGTHPVFWYAQRDGIFTTSSYYADTLPTWVREFNAEDRPVARYAGTVWDLLLPASEYPEPDSVEFESRGRQFQFPHQLPEAADLARSMLIGHPLMDEMTLDFAWRGIRAMDLGAGPQADIISVALSTMDAVGHRFGPDSRELHDFVLRLDRMLEPFLDSLIALRGREHVVIALTSDHGVAPIPEVRSTWGDNSKARRVMLRDFDSVYPRLTQIIQQLGLPVDAFALDWPALVVDRGRVQGMQREILQVARAFAREARRVPGVLRVDAIDDLARADTVRDHIARRWLHTFRPGGNALAVITLEPYNYMGSAIATHGSPHDYDAIVPVLFWGRAFRAVWDDGTARVVDIAPTLAHLLGIPPMESLDGVVLGRAFRSVPD